jgi:hypothetical protein
MMCFEVLAVFNFDDLTFNAATPSQTNMDDDPKINISWREGEF